MENRVNIAAYEVPEVIGSFDAQDVLGTAYGQGGSVIIMPN